MEMNPVWPLIFTVFFGVFHVLGGAAVGLGLRALQRGSEEANGLLLQGAIMGLLPLVFDWFFLIAPGNLLLGLVGPFLFVVAALASPFLESKVDGPALISAVFGSFGLLLGILVIPLMLDAARTGNFGTSDYIFGSCFVLGWVVLGATFAWNGFTAIVRGISLDQEFSEREQKFERRGKSKKV